MVCFLAFLFHASIHINSLLGDFFVRFFYVISLLLLFYASSALEDTDHTDAELKKLYQKRLKKKSCINTHTNRFSGIFFLLFLMSFLVVVVVVVVASPVWSDFLLFFTHQYTHQ